MREKLTVAKSVCDGWMLLTFVRETWSQQLRDWNLFMCKHDSGKLSAVIMWLQLNLITLQQVAFPKLKLEKGNPNKFNKLHISGMVRRWSSLPPEARTRLGDDNLPKQICLSGTPEITGRKRTFALYFAISFPCNTKWLDKWALLEAENR